MDQSPADRLKAWYLATARDLRAHDRLPTNPEEAARRAAAIRASIQAAAGEWPVEKAPLDPQILGTLDREGYRVEKLVFQTRLGCYATATCYVPTTGSAPYPAVLCVHGHWQGARRDPVVQSRCIGLAKLGFVVLTLDAWGAGERGTVIGQNEYHGGLLGASLWPVGTPLHGLQLYDNVRALDYLQSRKEVDGTRLGCTGASGGGNQTTQLSAFDERVKCAVPVCSVGTFHSYLTAACCVDEVLNGGLTFAEEGDLLGMVAPRALLVITASQDVPHFGPAVAAEALKRAGEYFHAHREEDRVRHVIVQSGHAYNQPMREAMYGWMRRWLKGEGDGSPTPEPAFTTEDPETLRCFALPFRAGRVMTTVAWVGQRSQAIAAAHSEPVKRGDWERVRSARVRSLRASLALPAAGFSPVLYEGAVNAGAYPVDELASEPDLRIPTAAIRGADRGDGAAAVILLHPAGLEAALRSELAGELRARGIHTRALELRGSGSLTLPNQGLGAAIPDHNLVEWSLWLGRPLLGQWVHDLRQLMTSMEGRGVKRFGVVGWREGALAAVVTAAVDERLRGTAALEPLLTFTGGSVPHEHRMAVFHPRLMEAGDIPHLTALGAPRGVAVAAPVKLDGTPATAREIDPVYAWSRDLYQTLGQPERLKVGETLSAIALADSLSSWLAPRKR